MNFQKFKEKTINFFKTKKNFWAPFLIFFVVVFTIVFVIGSSFNSQKNKSWELTVAYSQSSKKIVLDNLKVINRKTIVDERQAMYSPYKLELLNEKGNVIFQEKVNITEQILYDFFINSTESADLTPRSLKSVIYIPYQNEAVKIVIFKENSKVLEINLPKNVSYNLIKEAEAQTQSVMCGPLQVVFINNNYTNVDKFRSDVAYLKNLYNSTPPYNTSSSIFDFKEIDNPQNFGCETSGIEFCMNNRYSQIQSVGLNQFPQAQKFILLVDNSNAASVDKGLAGAASGVGGNVIIFTNYIYQGNSGGIAFVAAAHELEGHAVGWLYDRYVYIDASYGQIGQGEPATNCSANPSGESFWSKAGSSSVFKGCGNVNQYAPSDPKACVISNPKLIAGGPSNSAMSAAGCTNVNQFDPVEQYWIKNNILPYYQPCVGSTPVPTQSPNLPTSTPIVYTPSPTAQAISHEITGIAYVDANSNFKYDIGEKGYQGLKVTISGPVSINTVTDTAGGYSFKNIPVGNYSISAFSDRLSFTQTNLPPITQNVTLMQVNFPIPPLLTTTPTPNAVSTPTPSPANTPVSNPGSPQNLKAHSYCGGHGENTNNVSFTDFSWDNVPGAQQYIVFYSKGVNYGPYPITTNNLTTPLHKCDSTYKPPLCINNQCQTDPKQTNTGYGCGFTPGTVSWKVATADSNGNVTSSFSESEFEAIDCSSNSTPTPTPQGQATTYTCVFDPSCASGKTSMQICPLICTPN
jgi:hypothetical protein